MNRNQTAQNRLYYLMCGASVAAIMLSSNGALAQTGDELALEEITVTSSRISKSGFEAPTPVSVIGAADIEARGATNVANIINEMPGFTGTLTSASTTSNSRGNGINALDLRGLGANRNLVLINGRRHVPSDEFGRLDLNIIPSLAIERVEVVTGGASAAWGSDAISGVVNIIYDKNLDGLKTEAQFGISDEGDAEDYRLSMAYGSRTADDRGHFLIAADYDKNKGIPLATARGWSNKHPGILTNPADTGPNDGIPAYRIIDNARLFLGSPNGVTMPGGPLGNLEFQPDGTVIPRELGVIGGVMMEGGSGSALTDFAALAVPVERKNVLMTFDYALTEDVNFYFEGSAAKSNSRGAFVNSFLFGSPIKSGNPFLPASVQQIMTDEGIASFNLHRTNDEFGPITSVSETNSFRFVGGFNGQFENGWNWDVYYQYGHVSFSNIQENNLIKDNMSLAMDAVTDPVSGEIVCASGAPGCVPINLFGAGSPSQAAIDYVTGASMSDTTLKQQVAAASLNGDVFDNWAGTVSMAVGVEYRKESLNRIVDDISEQSGFLTVNAQPLSGEYNVKEAFAEILVPILKDSAIGESMDFNGAIRYTDYSTSGSVVTWKAGMTYNPVSDLRFRGTVSRDIRAPAIGETFLKTLLLFGNVNNPFTGGSDFIEQRNTGNSDLKAERALTKTIGAVYSPGWFQNFQMSLDWYDIKISDAIAQIDTQSIVDRCGGGEASFCDLIEFASNGSIVGVTNKLLNLGTYRLKGLDLEARYLTSVGDSGTLGFNLMGTYIYTKNISPDGLNPTNYAGEVGQRSDFGLPKWKLRGSVTYGAGPLGLFTQVRYVGAGKYSNDYGPEDLSDADNSIAAEVYVDVSARYALDVGGARNLELFAGINNVFDNDPPALPADFIASKATNPVHYDVIGRYLYTGIRAKF